MSKGKERVKKQSLITSQWSEFGLHMDSTLEVALQDHPHEYAKILSTLRPLKVTTESNLE
jgi:hypothetical protein